MAKSGINKVILVGHVGNPPEYKQFENGGAVAAVSLASGESWKDKNTGEEKQKTQWHRLVFRNRGNYRLADYVMDSVTKGTKLYVEGQIEYREYEQNGEKKYITEIIVQEMQVMAGRVPKPETNAPQSPQPNQPNQPPNAPPSNGAFDDDIPF